MKPEILNNDHMMFLDRALDTQRTALLTAMADAVAECRFVGPMGLAAYAELSGMMASLMLGEWFD